MNLFPIWVFSVDAKCGSESTQFFTFYSLHSSQSSTSQPISEPQTVDEKLSSLSDNGDFVFGWWESEGKGESWFIHGVFVGKRKEDGEGRTREAREERGERNFLFIKILSWESTITMYIYMITRFPMIICKFRETDELGFFLMFFYDIFPEYREEMHFRVYDESALIIWRVFFPSKRLVGGNLG
jgi:hypothetical protein